MNWTKMKEFPRYEMDEIGNIRHIKTKRPKAVYIGSTGYYMVSINKDGKSKPRRLHRLIAQMFIPNPKNKPCINHKDGNKLNNALGNLEWCDVPENNKHAFRTGLANNSGENNGMSKLTSEQVLEIRRLLKTGMSQYKIANRIGGITRSAVLRIKYGGWKHI